MRPSASGPSWRQTLTVIFTGTPRSLLAARLTARSSSRARRAPAHPSTHTWGERCLLARSSRPDLALRSRPLARWSAPAVVANGLLVRPLLHLDVLVHQRLLVQDRTPALARELPGRHVGELVVVAQRLAVGGLRLRAEVPTTGFATVQRIDAHELAQLQEVGDPAGPLE